MQKYQINPEKVKQDCLIIPVFEDKGFDTWIKNVDQKLNGLLTKVFESKDFEAKKKQSSLLFISDGEISRVLLVGLGKTKDLTVKNYKEMIKEYLTAIKIT